MVVTQYFLIGLRPDTSSTVKLNRRDLVGHYTTRIWLDQDARSGSRIFGVAVAASDATRLLVSGSALQLESPTRRMALVEIMKDLEANRSEADRLYLVITNQFPRGTRVTLKMNPQTSQK